jgi:hypothetical protein
MTAIDEKQLAAEIAGLRADLEKLKNADQKPTTEKNKDFWIKLISSVLLPLAIALSGYWFTQAIKSQELRSTAQEARLHDSLDNAHFQENLKLSLQTQRLENYKFITPMLEILAGSDPKRKTYATGVVLAIMPEEGPQLLNMDPASSAKYQATLTDRKDLLVVNLFSEDASIRTTSANDIMVNWYKTFDIADSLINYAGAHMDNANGIYNTIIVLQNMSGQVLKVKKQPIQAFLQKVMGMKNRGKTVLNATALNAALEKL